jgi:hypothetical protein
MSNIKIKYIKENDDQVRKAFDVLMVWYNMDANIVLGVMKNNPIAVQYSGVWTTTLKTKVQVITSWTVGEKLDVGNIRAYNGIRYSVVTKHVAALGQEPNVSAYFKVAFEDDIQEWVRPTGKADSYPIGAKVKWNGKTWGSTVKDNEGEPGISGWIEI